MITAAKEFEQTNIILLAWVGFEFYQPRQEIAGVESVLRCCHRREDLAVPIHAARGGRQAVMHLFFARRGWLYVQSRRVPGAEPPTQRPSVHFAETHG
jgi:hypothetical protein